MSAFDKIKSLLKNRSLADDGSKELAKEWLALLDTEKEMRELLNNKGFKKMLDFMKRDFIARMQEIVNQDPELKAIKRMFIRTVGVQGTEERFTKYFEEFLEEPAGEK